MPMWKTKLQTVVGGRTSGITDDRLRVAANRFYDYRRKLKHLDSMLRAHLNDLKRAAASRESVVHALASMSVETPIIHLVSSNDVNNESSIPSYAKTVVRDPQTNVQLDRFEREIVSYVTEWERTVSTRVATELKHIANLHHTWTKYHQKVEQLKVQQQKKKKSADLEDKINWNESKLRTAKKEYRRNLIAVTLLTEEVTDKGWKDVIPLMIRLIDFDIHATKTANSLLNQLSTIREEMVDLASRYEMDYEAIRTGRLRVLLEEDASDFVDPSDLQDLESTIASIEGRATHKNTGTRTVLRAPLTPPCSDMDSAEGEKKDPTEKTSEETKERREEMKDTFDEKSCAVPNYPTSIYLEYQEGGASPADDETTLTGVQDLVSV